MTVVRPAGAPGAVFDRLDLRDGRVYGQDWATTPADLSDASFRGTDLRGAFLFGLGLTGADLRDARLAGTRFGTNLICPDGKLADVTVDGPRGCRP